MTDEFCDSMDKVLRVTIILVLSTIALAVLRFIAQYIPEEYIGIADACLIVLVIMDIFLVLKLMKFVCRK